MNNTEWTLEQDLEAQILRVVSATGTVIEIDLDGTDINVDVYDRVLVGA